MIVLNRLGAAIALALVMASSAQAKSARIPIRVVVVTTFEIGKDTGDRPGEFQNHPFRSVYVKNPVWLRKPRFRGPEAKPPNSPFPLRKL